MEKEQKKGQISWFWRWFLNNKVVTGLLIVLLCLLIVLVFSKVSYLFEPLWQFIGIVGLPVVMAGILYYMLNPIVNWCETRYKIPRLVTIIALFILIVGLIIWGVAVLVPKIQSQTISFINAFPSYWDTISDKANELLSAPWLAQIQKPLEQMSDDFFQSISNFLKNFSQNTFHGISNVVGVVANVVIALVTMPFVLFFLLKDDKKFPKYFIQFVPVKMRKPTLRVLGDVNRQVSQYVRGQLTVAFAVSIMFMIGFSIIGLDYSIAISVAAGFLNLIPYLGSFLAMIPAFLIALAIGPVMVIKVAIVFVIEQTIEGRVISPLVLGSKLDIHPITIIFVLLTTGKIFGIVGVILGIPGYAALKVLVTHLFEWYKEVSGLYQEDTPEPVPASEESPKIEE